MICYNNMIIQKSLPRLPVPSLEQTLTKYLDILKPIANEEQYERSAELVKKFQAEDGEGKKLQEMLKRKAAEEENWVQTY